MMIMNIYRAHPSDFSPPLAPEVQFSSSGLPLIEVGALSALVQPANTRRRQSTKRYRVVNSCRVEGRVVS